MLESQLQAKVIKYLKSKGAYVVKVIAANRAGIPDLLVCLNGQFIGIEIKRDQKKQLSPLQKVNMEQIIRAEGRYWLISDMEMLKNLFDFEGK